MCCFAQQERKKKSGGGANKENRLSSRDSSMSAFQMGGDDSNTGESQDSVSTLPPSLPTTWTHLTEEYQYTYNLNSFNKGVSTHLQPELI